MSEERNYPVFTDIDDDFHDEVMSERWWETETCWFSWNVPERKMGGWTYCQSLPNAGICNGGAWVWDDTAAYSMDLPHYAYYRSLQLPERGARDMRDFEWPNGVRTTVLEPLMAYRVHYDAPELIVDLEFHALIPPNPHPVGVAPFLVGTHFDQPGHVTGEMVLKGEKIEIDCYSVRDRSWGPRPAGRPRPKPADAPKRPPVGIGYCFGTANEKEAWLTYSCPSLDGDPVVCGFLLRDGVYAHILSGTRSMTVNSKEGWPETITIDAVDDLGRTLHVEGASVSRHRHESGGDTLMHWRWDGAEGYGEDQTYQPRSIWDKLRKEARS